MFPVRHPAASTGEGYAVDTEMLLGAGVSCDAPQSPKAQSSIASYPVLINSGTDRPESQSKEGGESAQGEWYRNLWEMQRFGRALVGRTAQAVLKQYSSTTQAVLHHLPQHLTFDDVAKVPETLAEP